jgi:septal ring factor EnvC (AmiA/AmiB activator)
VTDFIERRLDKLESKLDDIKDDNAAIKAEQVQFRLTVEKHEAQDETRHLDVKKLLENSEKHSLLLADYNNSLREHMRRTEILEDRLEPVYNDWAEQKVIKKHKIATWKKVAAIIATLATIIGTIITIYQIF